jgi:hypothetical protein
MMKIFMNMMSNLSKLKVPLGRWNILNHDKSMLKVKYATEDNCFMSSHNRGSNVEDLAIGEEKKYIHIMGYESVDN